MFYGYRNFGEIGKGLLRIKKIRIIKKQRNFNMTEDFLIFYIFLFINLHKTMQHAF